MDAKRRALERRASLGDVQAEARLLRDRLRTGDLDVDRLRIAALCSHAAAQLALPDGPVDVPGDITVWLRRLHAEHGALPVVTALQGLCVAARQVPTPIQGDTSALLEAFPTTPHGPARDPNDVEMDEAMGVAWYAFQAARDANFDVALRQVLVEWTLGYSDPGREFAALRARDSEGG